MCLILGYCRGVGSLVPLVVMVVIAVSCPKLVLTTVLVGGLVIVMVAFGASEC